MSKLTRPVLRWPGNKWRLAPWIISHLPAHKHYVEPFGGSAAVLLRKRESEGEIYNDADTRLADLFRVLGNKTSRAELAGAIEVMPYDTGLPPFQHPEGGRIGAIEMARRLIVDTSLRTDRRRKRYAMSEVDWRRLPSDLLRAGRRCDDLYVLNWDAKRVIAEYDRPETLFFIDPPYHPETRSRSDDYAHEMTALEHEQLLALIRRCRGMVVLSGYPHPTYETALSDWERVERRQMAGGYPLTEVLWINPAASAALREAR